MKLDQMEILVTRQDSASVNQIMGVKSAMNARMDTMTIQAAHSVSVMFTVQSQKFATKTLDFVYVKKAMVQHVAIVACQVFTTILNVSPVTVQRAVQHHKSVIIQENAHVFRTFLENVAISARQVIMTIQLAFPATVRLGDLLVFLVTMKDSATARAILMAKTVMNVKRTTTTTHFVKAVTATLLV